MNPKLGAIRALRSWLDASGVQYVANGEDITVNGHSVNLEATDITSLLSTNLERGLNVFDKITKAVGLENVPVPVNRGVQPTKREYDDRILSRFRHREFHTAPNNPSFLAQHNGVIERECRIFMSKNKRLCAELGYEFDDLKSYAMVWATTFAHRSAVNKEGDDNARLLTRFLRQRFTELFKSFVLERRGALPESLTIDAICAQVDDDEVDPEYVKAHDEIKSKSLFGRKAKAAALLDEHLNALGHDKMVAALEMAVEHPCPDSRKLAKRKLNQHQEGCELCKTRLAQVAV